MGHFINSLGTIMRIFSMAPLISVPGGRVPGDERFRRFVAYAPAASKFAH